MMNSMKSWVKISLFLLLLLLVSVFAVCYVNRTEVYSFLAKYYIKRDDYKTAQHYYEKSYLLGNKTADFRENYVNLLINSPLTLEAQKRLADIAEDDVKDSASENAKYFLYNIKREIHNKYPNNYVQNAPYNQKIVHWGKFPITYSINNTKGVPDDIVKSVNDAFDTWERASSARIRFSKVPINADIVVNFVNYKTENAEYGKKYVVAYTIPNIYQNRLNRMDIVLNVTNLDGKKFTSNQIYNTALHEIFHALGFMGHSFDKSNIMYMTNDNTTVIEDKRKELTDSDKLTLELLYKIKPDITNSNELIYDYIPYPVIGDNVDINYAKAEEARSYIRKAPSVSAGYIDLAQTQVNQKNYTEAIRNLEKAYRLATNDETRFMLLFNLAVASYMEDNCELAQMYISKARELKSDDDLEVLAAQVYLKQNNSDEATKIYAKLSEKNPNNMNYVLALANIYIKNKKYKEARIVLKNFVKNNPEQKLGERLKLYSILLF